MTDRWQKQAEAIRELVEPLINAVYAQGTEGWAHDDEAGSAQAADDALMAGICAALSDAFEAGRREALDALLADHEANDAARHIMMWMDMGDRPTEAGLFYPCNRFGHPLPDGCRDVDHVPPKATRTYWVLKAIVDEHRAAAIRSRELKG